MELFCMKQYALRGGTHESKAAQLTETGTAIVRLFARFALGASFLSAVADRFGLWGHMEQRTYPGEIPLISWSTQAR